MILLICKPSSGWAPIISTHNIPKKLLNTLKKLHLEGNTLKNLHFNLNKLLKLNLSRPHQVKWQLMVASCYRRSGNYAAALENYKSIHRKFPDNIECIRIINF